MRAFDVAGLEVIPAGSRSVLVLPSVCVNVHSPREKAWSTPRLAMTIVTGTSLAALRSYRKITERARFSRLGT